MLHLNEITKPVFGTLLDRLCVGYQYRIPEAWKAKTFEEYFKQVKRFDVGIVETAIEDLIAEPTRGFPRAGELRGRCFKAEKELKASQPEPPRGDVDRCPVCRAEFFVAGYESATGVVVGRMRCKCPQGGRGWETEKAQAYRAPQVYGHAGFDDSKEALRRLVPSPAAVGIEGQVFEAKARFHRPPVDVPEADRGDAWEPDA